MKKLIAVLVVALTTSLLSGCATRAQEAALVGGLVGFGVGATVPRPAPSPRVVVVERVVVPSSAMIADPKTPGTPCRDNATGRVGQWKIIDGQKWC